MKLLTVIFALALFLSVFNSKAQGISLGIEGGMISSVNTRYKIEDLENRRNTYYSGLNINYHFSEAVSISSGLHYLRQGYKDKTWYTFEEGVKNKLTGKIDYVIVPVCLNLGFGNSNRFLTTIGFFGGYNIKASIDYPLPTGLDGDAKFSRDFTYSTVDFNVGGIIGAGYKVFENDKLQINSMLKYYLGMSYADRKMPYLRQDNKYSSALLSVALNYKIGK